MSRGKVKRWPAVRFFTWHRGHRRKECTYKVRVGTACVTDTNFLPAGGAMRRCPKPREGFQLGHLFSLGDLFSSQVAPVNCDDVADMVS